MQVEPLPTIPNHSHIVAALGAAWVELTGLEPRNLVRLVALWGMESNWCKAPVYNHNWCNLAAREGRNYTQVVQSKWLERHEITYHRRCHEDPTLTYEDTGQGTLRRNPYSGKQESLVWFQPPHPECNRAAYSMVGDAALDHVARILRRYDSIRDVLYSGTTREFVGAVCSRRLTVHKPNQLLALHSAASRTAQRIIADCAKRDGSTITMVFSETLLDTVKDELRRHQ